LFAAIAKGRLAAWTIDRKNELKKRDTGARRSMRRWSAESACGNWNKQENADNGTLEPSGGGKNDAERFKEVDFPIVSFSFAIFNSLYARQGACQQGLRAKEDQGLRSTSDPEVGGGG